MVNPKVLAMPVLDQIPQENWHMYYPMAPGHWRYEWNFNLVYTSLKSGGGSSKSPGNRPCFVCVSPVSRLQVWFWV